MAELVKELFFLAGLFVYSGMKKVMTGCSSLLCRYDNISEGFALELFIQTKVVCYFHVNTFVLFAGQLCCECVRRKQFNRTFSRSRLG